ncbi:alpha/beta hydrolase [soil metagenome]
MDHTLKTSRHTTHYLEAGPANGVPIIFVHGWPELSISWRHQLPVMAGLGLRAIAPDMRGYGRSSTYPKHEDYGLEHTTADMIELLDHLGAEKAIFVGHDWGSPVVWSLAQQHPDRCHGVANLCVPYQPNGFAVENLTALVDRDLYPEAEFPVGQWDYQMYYRESFAAACAAFDGDVRAAVRVMFRAGNAAGQGQPAMTAMTRRNGGWFGPGATAPKFPRDDTVITEADENAYTASLERNGFFGPNSWYMNAEPNVAFAAKAKAHWRLQMPVLFLHATYDYICATVGTRLADPMRENCANLTEATVQSGHWMAQEKPMDVNAALAKWLSAQLPELWPAG